MSFASFPIAVCVCVIEVADKAVRKPSNLHKRRNKMKPEEIACEHANSFI